MVIECECGNEYEKQTGWGGNRMDGCPACRSLDGETSAEGAAISTLRTLGPSTVYQVADYIGISPRNALKALIRLEKRGRVRGEQEPEVGWCKKHSTSTNVPGRIKTWRLIGC